MKIYISGPITHEPKADENFKKAQIILSKMYPNAEIKNPILIPSPKFTQDDGLHPNSLAQPLILENIWPKLHGLLNSI